jgi:endonuclease/exonuclease/phosphatase family metal-dependent hydrolase
MKRMIIFACLLLPLCSFAQTYSILTYNIRFDNPADGPDKWDNRKEGLTKLVKGTNADVIGFQEVLHPQLEYLGKELTGYKYLGVGRDDGKTLGEYLPIFYKVDKFTLMKNGWFWLSETPEKPSKGWDAACNRMCNWAVLRDTITHKNFLFINTHLDHKGKLAQENSIRQIVDFIYKIGDEYVVNDSLFINEDILNWMPVVWVGDFNLQPTDKLYNNIAVDGQLTLRGRDDSFIKSVNKPMGTIGTFNGFKLNEEYKGRIDYVWLIDFEAQSYKVLNDKLPNGRWPSDHFPLLVEIVK